MAKNKSPLFQVSGTILGVTYVQTKKGIIVRAPRGTYTKTDVNDAYKKENSRNSIVNRTAQLLNNVVGVYAGHFKKSDLWQDMLSRIRRSVSDSPMMLLKTLEGLEINPKYALDKLVNATKVEAVYSEGIMTLLLLWSKPWLHEAPEGVNGYRFEMCVIYGDDELQSAGTEIIQPGWYHCDLPDGRYETTFEIPPLTK